MARWLYCLLLYLGVPLVWLRLFWRSRRQPEYRRHLGERWGFYPPRPAGKLLWLHAVSVGETRAAEPLVAELLARHPDCRLLLTGMTPTGRDAGAAVYGKFGERVIQAYLPYDYPGAVARFLDHFRPESGVLMETEIWPNLLAACRRRQLPVVLANARLSERSLRGYLKFAALARPAFAALAGAAAQTGGDAERLRRAGVESVAVCGNLKFDVVLPETALVLGAEWKAALAGRPVWLAASTREGEEVLLLDAWARAALPAQALFVLVPRHPQRFAEVAALLDQRGLRWKKRSAGLPDAGTQVWLGDSMGEMPAYYRLADCAYIGGSLLPLGGQNLIEAAACGCPVLVGEHTFNFAQATDDALAAGAAQRIGDADALLTVVGDVLRDEKKRQGMASAARGFAAAHRGATARTVEFISQRTDQAGH